MTIALFSAMMCCSGKHFGRPLSVLALKGIGERVSAMVCCGNMSDSPIYDKIDYVAMPDVPYELDRHSLVMMQKLERGLHYLLDNLLKLDMTLEEVAERAGYSPSYFKAAFVRHFEMPFARFLVKLRMRQAARDIRNEHFPKGIPKRYGYADSASFSKAFRREMGVSPQRFYKGNYDIPDMPMRQQLGGVPIALEYTVQRAIVVHGAWAPPPHGAQTFLMDSLALPYTGAFPQFDALRPTLLPSSGSGDYVGVWNYHPETGMCYVFGPVVQHLDCISASSQATRLQNGMQRLVMQGGRYAVFSYARPADDADIPLMQRMLSRFVLQEWVPMNCKTASTMGFTYERFTPQRVYLCLPIASGMDTGDGLNELRWGLADWAHHIDGLIARGIDLDVESLAQLEGYSEKNYSDVFSMYYGLTPLAYVRRRRLYLANAELNERKGPVAPSVGEFVKTASSEAPFEQPGGGCVVAGAHFGQVPFCVVRAISAPVRQRVRRCCGRTWRCAGGVR